MDGNLVLITYNPVRTEQVITNVIHNAIKYSPAGGTIEVRLEQDFLRDEVSIAVKDQGIGMSADDMKKIFEPYHRAAGVREDLPGVGLGLFVSKKIMESQHGVIEVSSQPGKGSTFTIRFSRQGKNSRLEGSQLAG